MERHTANRVPEELRSARNRISMDKNMYFPFFDAKRHVIRRTRRQNIP
jgi:hypothetical protein